MKGPPNRGPLRPANHLTCVPQAGAQSAARVWLCVAAPAAACRPHGWLCTASLHGSKTAAGQTVSTNTWPHMHVEARGELVTLAGCTHGTATDCMQAVCLSDAEAFGTVMRVLHPAAQVMPAPSIANPASCHSTRGGQQPQPNSTKSHAPLVLCCRRIICRICSILNRIWRDNSLRSRHPCSLDSLATSRHFSHNTQPADDCLAYGRSYAGHRVPLWPLAPCLTVLACS